MPEIARLVAAARGAGETELNISWSIDIVGGPGGAQPMADLMNRMYGLNIKINFTPGPSMTNMAGKIVQEAAAGQTASTDILIGSELHYATLVQADALESYDYTQLSPRITPELVTPNSVGVEYASRFPDITYNTNLISPSEAPKTLQAIIDPRWKGKIASGIDAADFDRIATLPDWGPARTESFLTQLSQEVGGLLRCGEEGRIGSGEFELMVMDCGTYAVRKTAAQGAPVAGIIPPDAADMAFWYLGVPKTSAHPNLAKLYINAIMSVEGQQILYGLDDTDDADLAGSQSAAELSGLRAQGVEPLRVDVKYVLDHPDLQPLSDKFISILQQGSGGQ